MTLALRNLILLLLLQLHGPGEGGPCLSVVPRLALASSPESGIVLLAHQYRQETLAEIDRPQRSVAFPPVGTNSLDGSSAYPPELPCAAARGALLIYQFMALKR